MSTPERGQDPGEHGYGSAKQDYPAGDDEREETPQERSDAKDAEQRRLIEEQSEAQSEPAQEHVPPTDEIPLAADEGDLQGRETPTV